MSKPPIPTRKRKPIDSTYQATTFTPRILAPGEQPLSPRPKAGAAREVGATLKRHVDSYEKASLAIQLSIAGATYEQIAKQVGYADRFTVHKAIKRRLNELHAQCMYNVEEWRQHRLLALKSRERTLTVLANDKDLKPADRIAAIRELNQIDKRVAAITGSDKPQEHTVSFPGATVDVRTLTDGQLERLAAGDYSALAEAAAGAGASRDRAEAGTSAPDRDPRSTH